MALAAIVKMLAGSPRVGSGLIRQEEEMPPAEDIKLCKTRFKAACKKACKTCHRGEDMVSASGRLMGRARFAVAQHARDGAQLGLSPAGVIQPFQRGELIFYVSKEQVHSLLLLDHDWCTRAAPGATVSAA